MITFVNLGQRPYLEIWERMQVYTEKRTSHSPDCVWFVEHPPVYTQGYHGDPAHIISPGSIPVVQVDRGGQVTYHGPGQLLVYVLIDLNRLKIGPKKLVCVLENAVMDLLNSFRLEAHRINTRPGVYVNHQKLCAVGLKIKKRCSYHGLALNVDMDLTPFQYIHPCGDLDQRVTDLNSLGIHRNLHEIQSMLAGYLTQRLENLNCRSERPSIYSTT